jgi:hypothetical protein
MEYDSEFLALVVVLLKLVFLSMVLERALVILFEWRWYEKYLSRKGFKIPITYIVAWIICNQLKFDVFAAIFNPRDPESAFSDIGVFLTAAVLAGGSAGAITLFQVVLRMSKSARAQMLGQAPPPAQPGPSGQPLPPAQPGAPGQP